MEVHQKFQDLRERVLRDEEVSAEEYGRLIEELRGDKVSLSDRKARKESTRSTVKEVDPDDIFG